MGDHLEVYRDLFKKNITEDQYLSILDTDDNRERFNLLSELPVYSVCGRACIEMLEKANEFVESLKEYVTVTNSFTYYIYETVLESMFEEYYG